MNDTHAEILSALCDGEVVDPEALRVALEDPQARHALVDFARLRAAAVSSAALPASLSVVPAAPRRFRARAGVLAAAIVVLALISGALIRATWALKRAETPPVPSRVVRYEPGIDWHQVSR